MWGIDDAEKSRTDTYIGGAHKKWKSDSFYID
jgi:hypothetical protein